MGARPTSFHRLQKTFRSLLTPAFERRLFWQPIKSRVNLNGRKPGRVVFQMTFSRTVFRIEGLSPTLIHPTARPDVDLCRAHIG